MGNLTASESRIAPKAVSLDCLIVQTIVELHSAGLTDSPALFGLIEKARGDFSFYLSSRSDNVIGIQMNGDWYDAAYKNMLDNVRDIVQSIPMDDKFARAVTLKIAPAIKDFAANIRSYPFNHSVGSWRFLLNEISTLLQSYTDGDYDAGDRAYRLIANNITSLWD